MQWLFDHTGKKYLDMFGGIVTVSVGHCHPYVVNAVEKQMRKLWHTTNIYLHPNLHIYAEKLCTKLPGDLKVNYIITIECYKYLDIIVLLTDADYIFLSGSIYRKFWLGS